MRFCLLSIIVFCCLSTQAHNLQITNLITTDSTVTINVSWNNSWNSTNNVDPLFPNNWDAVWLFVKYQSPIDNLWKHVKLSNASADHSVTGAGGVLQVDAVTDSMGVFVRRTNAGSGHITNATVTLRMGNLSGTAPFNFKVFGVEMVYVNKETFWIGDGTAASVNYLPNIQIDSSFEANGQVAGGWYSGSPATPATFNLGYSSFYCMKYEASTEQYADFLNLLTYDQQAFRAEATPNSAIGTIATFGVTGTADPTNDIIEIMTPGMNNTKPAEYGCDFIDDNIFNTNNDGQNIALTGISKADYAAYLDWSGLRPMTEFEFEKACRGPRPSVVAERAWGSATLNAKDRTDITAGTSGFASESITGVIVNGRFTANNATGGGTTRCGIYATSATGREAAGATFYGIMDMSGNAAEITVPCMAGNVTFDAQHGDGTLTTTGEANVANWPDPNIANTYMIKGGNWYQNVGYNPNSRTSHRLNTYHRTTRSPYTGIRGVRTF